MLKLLHGHTSVETAYNNLDYPYGRGMRTTRQMWVETATKGSKSGLQRGCTRTYDPSITSVRHWNNPKNGNYFQRVYLYLDTQTEHAHFFSFDLRDPYDGFASFKANGLFHQLTTEELKELNAVIEKEKRLTAILWDDFRNVCAKVDLMLREKRLGATELYELGSFGVPDSGYGYYGQGISFKFFAQAYRTVCADLFQEFSIDNLTA